jgi:hypothetical protein
MAWLLLGPFAGKSGCLQLYTNQVEVPIPCHCGYASSPAYFKTYFKRVTGLTMREWREQTGRAHVPRAGGARENK